MAQGKLISPISKKAYERTKVAAYCRVSSNSADQLNSYAAQIQAYTKLIKSRVFTNDYFYAVAVAGRPANGARNRAS